VLCERATGVSGAESMAVVDNRDTVFLSAVASDAEDRTAILRSRDSGRTWSTLRLPKGFATHEAHLTPDPVTGRLFITSLGLGQSSEKGPECGTPLAYSDDEGSTWHMAATRPGCPYTNLGDWPKVFTGPYKGRPLGSYSRAVYHCNIGPAVLTNPLVGCWRSDDGGATFAFQSFLPTLPLAGSCGTEPPFPVLHATGSVDAAGVVRVPLTTCGRIGIMTSEDHAKTWRWTDVGHAASNAGTASKVLTEPGTPPVDNFLNGLISNVLDEDTDGNLYLTWVDRVVQLAVSKDGGKTWKVRAVSPPSLRAQLPSLDARRAGEVALSYVATADPGGTDVSHRWKAWMSYSADASASRPVFSSGAISPRTVFTDGPGKPCCFGRSDSDGAIFGEYTGVEFAPDGAAWAGFLRFAADGSTAELVSGELRLPSRARSRSRGRHRHHRGRRAGRRAPRAGHRRRP
jgi:hypothetical protein